jgi:ribose-phosphate pyrophosphokinase
MNSSREFGNRVADSVAETVVPHEEREFEDGEHKIRPLENVRNQNVFVIDSLYADARQSVNDKLCRLLFLIGAIRDASASRVTAVVPYLCYSRKDRKTKSRDPVTTRYVARMFEAIGTDHLVSMDVHNLEMECHFHPAWDLEEERYGDAIFATK